MAMFSSGMALPFFVLALFPAFLKKLPKSGGWLGQVKKTMAFLVLAAAFKYLSNVDMVYQWEILTRERFLAIWIVLLTLAAFYLLGFFRFPDEPSTSRLTSGPTSCVARTRSKRCRGCAPRPYPR